MLDYVCTQQATKQVYILPNQCHGDCAQKPGGAINAHQRHMLLSLKVILRVAPIMCMSGAGVLAILAYAHACDDMAGKGLSVATCLAVPPLRPTLQSTLEIAIHIINVLIVVILTHVHCFSFSSDRFSSANHCYKVITKTTCVYVYPNFPKSCHRFYSERILVNQHAFATRIVVYYPETTQALAIMMESTMSHGYVADRLDLQIRFR